MRFAPIAVVGQACLLPGATTPEQLWRLVLEARTATGPCPEGDSVPDGRSWPHRDRDGDRAISDCGGYVRDSRIFLIPGFIPPEEITTLDPLFHWLLHVLTGPWTARAGDVAARAP